MTKSRKMSALTALGSLTAAVALLAGAPDAGAQPAQAGGGSFPGSFLVPGTNTSIKIGGFVKIVGIYDLDARNGDTIATDTIPMPGSAAHGLHGATRIHARQSNINVDTRTPTAYGDLTTFVLLDFFGQNTSQAEHQSNTQNARLVYAYGTLGPFLAGQWVSLFADTDAIPESVDPTGFIGAMDGLDNRQPQFRYTIVAPGVARASKASYAGQLSGHLNTFGKDAFKWTVAAGKAPGHYLTALGRDSGADGLQFNTATGAVHAPYAYTINAGYTHWWTAAMRSSLDAGYGKNQNSTSILASAAAQTAADKWQMGGRANLIWSPVPQVDLGVEYDYAQRRVQSSLHGNLHRVEIESVFKF